MGVMASQITSLTSVYTTVYSGADRRKHQNVSIWWRHHDYGVWSIFANHWSIGTSTAHVIPKPFWICRIEFQSHTIFFAPQTAVIWFRRTPVWIWQRLPSGHPDKIAFLLSVVCPEVNMRGIKLHFQQIWSHTKHRIHICLLRNCFCHSEKFIFFQQLRWLLSTSNSIFWAYI